MSVCVVYSRVWSPLSSVECWLEARSNRQWQVTVEANQTNGERDEHDGDREEGLSKGMVFYVDVIADLDAHQLNLLRDFDKWSVSWSAKSIQQFNIHALHQLNFAVKTIVLDCVWLCRTLDVGMDDASIWVMLFKLLPRPIASVKREDYGSSANWYVHHSHPHVIGTHQSVMIRRRPLQCMLPMPPPPPLVALEPNRPHRVKCRRDRHEPRRMQTGRNTIGVGEWWGKHRPIEGRISLVDDWRPSVRYRLWSIQPCSHRERSQKRNIARSTVRRESTTILRWWEYEDGAESRMRMVRMKRVMQRMPMTSMMADCPSLSDATHTSRISWEQYDKRMSLREARWRHRNWTNGGRRLEGGNRERRNTIKRGQKKRKS